MLKTRIIPTLLYKNTTLVKGKSFDSWRRVGSVIQSIKVYNLREVDELIFVDISATEEGREPDYDLIDDFADDCFMPLTVGGGITSADQVRKVLSVGADKVAVNTAAVQRPTVISEIASQFGSQCVVASIDYVKVDGDYKVAIRSGKAVTDMDPIEMAKTAEKEGAGEILLTSVEKDGLMEGYDLELTQEVCQAVSIPVIVSGGAGTYEHFKEGIDAGASAVAAASMFHFTENTPLEAKHYLKETGVNVRI